MGLFPLMIPVTCDVVVAVVVGAPRAGMGRGEDGGAGHCARTGGPISWARPGEDDSHRGARPQGVDGCVVGASSTEP
jgi:hypothetical protein